MSYIDLRHRPRNDVVCNFYLESMTDAKKAADSIAAESSTGTWTDVATEKPYMKNLGAKVFSIRKKGNGADIRIAYPLELFELGNVPQLLSSVAGNIFGMKDVKKLRLNDIALPREYVKGFKGPEIGLDELRRITKIKNRPLAGTIYKPKLGLRPNEMAKLAYQVYSNGIDYTKDDENLASMAFNKFEDRVIKVLDVVGRIKSEQGRSVIYAPNITAPANTMLKRAQFVKDHGGNCIMIDILTVGWSALQYIRDQNFKVIIHAHRASHASFTRNPKHGISMLVIAKLARLIGVTGLHTGTIIGKLEGPKEEVTKIDNFLRSKWFGMKKVMPIASGGLHPGLIPKLVQLLGKDLIINCGGGLWGHPLGPEAGAKAIKQAIDAAIKKIPIKEYAKECIELKVAIEKWGHVKF